MLEAVQATLLISTYQAGKLVIVRAGGRVSTLLRTFDQAMGLAADPRRMAIGTRDRIWLLRNAPDIAPQLEPVGRHDAVLLAPELPRDRRHPRPRTRLGEATSFGRSHPLLLPLDARGRLQLRPPLAPAVHHLAGRRRSPPIPNLQRERSRARPFRTLLGSGYAYPTSRVNHFYSGCESQRVWAEMSLPMSARDRDRGCTRRKPLRQIGI